MYSDGSGHSESEFLLSVGRNFEPNGAYKPVSYTDLPPGK